MSELLLSEEERMRVAFLHLGSWRRRAVRMALLSLLALAMMGCTGDPAPSPTLTTSVVVGVTSDLVPAKDMSRLHVIMRVDGTVLRDEIRAASDPEPLAFPLELPFGEVPDGARVEVTLEALEGYQTAEAPLLTRTAATTVIAGRVLLLRARLEVECVPGFRIEGDRIAPTCTAPETCVAATCRDPFIAPEELEDYRASWASSFADDCKPLNPAAAVVLVGEGRDAYRPLEEDEGVRIERGGQGGYHVWVAVRMKNLHQAGSVTHVTGYADDIGIEVFSFEYVFGYEEAAGGACDLYGLRCQVFFEDFASLDDLVDKPLDLDVTVVDVDGDVGIGHQRITLLAPL